MHSLAPPYLTVMRGSKHNFHNTSSLTMHVKRAHAYTSMHMQVLAQRLQPTSALLDALDEEWTSELVGAMRSPGSSPTGQFIVTLP